MKVFKGPPERRQLEIYRYLILGGGVAYLVWWFVVHAVLPHDYNPIASRLLILAMFLGVWVASFISTRVQQNLPMLHAGCAWFLTLHYFYLFYFNTADVNWVVGCYITYMAICACLLTERLLLRYSIFTLALSIALVALKHELLNTVFLSGMMTIAFFANFSLGARLKYLRQNRELAYRMESLFNAIFEGVLVHREGRIIESNRSLAKIFGYASEEIIGRSVLELVAPESRSLVARHLEKQYETPYEAQGQRRDGTLIDVELCERKHFFLGEIVNLIAVHDITARKLATENRVLYEASERALKIRDEFITIASHELKTPLTNIKLQAQLLTRAYQKADSHGIDHARVQRFAQHINAQTDRLAILVEDMLDISRIGTGNFPIDLRVINFASVVRRAVDDVQESYRQGGVLITCQCTDEVWINGDAARLQQLVLNLLSNALKYGDFKPVAVELSATAGRAVLQVRDRGLGIDPKSHHRIFDKFERAVSAQNISGFGLGLYLSREIAEAHHGKIELQSEIGQGSCFTVSFPLAERPVPKHIPLGSVDQSI